MAVTRVGLGGPSAAYLGFQPKSAQLLVFAQIEVTATYAPSQDVVGTNVSSTSIIGTVE